MGAGKHIPGELRLLILGRSGTGYQNVHPQQTLDQSLPLLESLTDPLVKAVELLITVTQEPDRSGKVELLLEGLETTSGAGAVPLLDSLAERALIAAQKPRVASLTRLLSDPSPEVRLEDLRLDGALATAVLDGRLDRTALLAEIEELIDKRRVRLGDARLAAAAN